MQFLERGLDGQNQWWKYLRVLFAGFILAGFIGLFALIAAIAYHTNGDVPLAALMHPGDYGISANVRLLCGLASFVGGLLIVRRLIWKLHKRSMAETINGTKFVRWSRFGVGALAWGSLQLACFAVYYALDPSNFVFSFDARPFIALVVISVLIIPIQASFEEIVLRGYLAQGLAAWTNNRWLVLLIPSLLFGLMHSGNPEVAQYGFWSVMPSYFVFGLSFGLISILDDGIEIAMGAHAVNNVVASVLITFKGSVMETPAVFYEVRVNPLLDGYILLLSSAAFLAMLAYRYRWRFSVLGQPVRPECAAEAGGEPGPAEPSALIVERSDQERSES